jgi:YYY domain-containing protein
MILYYLTNNNRFIKDDWVKWLAVLIILTPVAFIIRFQLLILLIPLLFLAYAGLIKENMPEKQFIYLLVLIGALLSLFAELFYIQDTMSKLVYFRFNTIFKLYSQIWILWGVAAGYAFYEMLKKKAAYVACILILMASIYPVFITIGQSKGFNIAPTLDGERSIKKEHPSEYEAIEWLRKINGTPVVLQAAGFSGTWNSYVSAFTGLPTVLGWEWHEYQWRLNLEEINIRRDDVERAYTSSDYEDIKNIIDKYDIKYIYVGPVERDRYKITNVFEREKEKFKLVFKNSEVEIFNYNCEYNHT